MSSSIPKPYILPEFLSDESVPLSGHDLFTNSLLMAVDPLQSERGNLLAKYEDALVRLHEAESRIQKHFSGMNSDRESREFDLGTSAFGSERSRKPAWLTALDDLSGMNSDGESPELDLGISAFGSERSRKPAWLTALDDLSGMNSDGESPEYDLDTLVFGSERSQKPAWLTALDDLLPRHITKFDSSEERNKDGSASRVSLDEEGEAVDLKGKGKEQKLRVGKKRTFSDLGSDPFLRTLGWSPLGNDYRLAHTRSLHERSSKRYFTGDPSGSWQVCGDAYVEVGC
ncbi:hypothetical protein FPV67DRAFT_1651881 [Lyophyllum atratum]|nr:hypothetical protein FPV67DRAFT_1651881 [Lyophyllum atratum]